MILPLAMQIIITIIAFIVIDGILTLIICWISDNLDDFFSKWAMTSTLILGVCGLAYLVYLVLHYIWGIGPKL